MFEQITFDTIMADMLLRVPDDIDKREGSIIYTALAPCAVELQNMYINLDMIIDEGFADTASYVYLIKRAAERNIFPKEATKAILRCELSPTTVEIENGIRFSSGDLHYVIKQKIQNGVYKVECEEMGTSGNRYFGEIIPIEHVEGLESARLTELLIPGEDEENEEIFRNRYFNSLDSQAFCGNLADYKEKTNEIVGVGGVKVYPAWNGGGTVKLIIIGSDYNIPSLALIELVQELIDPGMSGKGVGIAPIGHKVTVEGVKENRINIVSEIVYKVGCTFETAKAEISETIDNYFLELRGTWENEEFITVRISQLETRILTCAQVVDISKTKINNLENNINLKTDEIPVRGDLVG